MQAWWQRRGRTWRSTGTAAICMPRARLPLDALRHLWWRLAGALSAAAQPLPGTHGRRVLAVDGTVLQCPDTPVCQEKWPQPSTQKPGCGFPHLLLVAVFCLRSGALLRAVHGALKAHESRLLALLRPFFKKGDILVVIRCGGSWPARPGRSEPRCVKKRPRPYQLLTSPRHGMQTAPSRRHKGKQKHSTAPNRLHKSWA